MTETWKGIAPTLKNLYFSRRDKKGRYNKYFKQYAESIIEYLFMEFWKKGS